MMRRTRSLLVSAGLLLSLCATTLSAATMGTVVPIVGQVADLAYDTPRDVVYLANPTRSDVEIYSVGQRRLLGTIFTGLQPASLAIDARTNTLYVANIGSFSITAVDLTTRSIRADYGLGSRPDSIAIGNDGNVVILGTAGLQRLDPALGVVSNVPISPPPTPQAGAPNIPPGATPAGFLAGLVVTASGNLIIGLSTNRLFVYEVASGIVLRSRNVTGLRAILSASPDGSRFMAGPFLFDTQTLAILGRSGTVSPTMTGGSAFSADGNAVYASFSTQSPINPLNTNAATANVLQILRSSSLTPDTGLRVPEAITSKIIVSPDGQNLFANSTSGFTVIPIGQLSNLPVLDVTSTNVMLTVDTCNRTVATATVQVRNTGGGRATFAATVNNAAAPIALSQRTGVAPATLTISFDLRTIPPLGTSQFVVLLVSPEAVNVEPAILVNLNYRDVSQRGTIVPFAGVGVDMQMDAARQRLYIANYTRDQIEVFSLASQTFLPPIRVGNRPLSMTMANPNTLVVANAGGENLSVVDLDAMQEVDQILMGPLALNVLTPVFPHSIAASSNAILFSAVPLPAVQGLPPGNGSVWQLSLLTHSAFPRLNLGAGAANAVPGRNMLTAPGDGSTVVIVGGTGTLVLYDSIADTFPITRTTAVAGLRGTVSAAADGSAYVIDNSVFNSSLTLQGTIGPIGGAPAAAAAFGVVISGNNAIRVQGAAAPSTLQSLQRFNLTTLQSNLQITLPELVMDITPAATGVGTRQWPPRATALELGQNGQTQLLPRGMAADGSNNTYLLSLSGLSIVSLAASSGQTPSFQASGVVNSPSQTGPVSAGALISIRGTNLADFDSATATPLPTLLGGVCVTANEVAIPLLITSPTQIDAQLPPNIGPGRVTLTVRSTRLGVSSTGVAVQVNSSSPSLFSFDVDGQPRAALFHAIDGALVIPIYPADRDEVLKLYATGLGPTTPMVPAGQLNPSSPVLSTLQTIGVTIGGHPYEVLSSQLAPGYVGVYEIDIYVPGNRVRGDDLPVVVTAGGASSGTDNAPLASIQ